MADRLLGLGKTAGGEGVLGLQRAFQVAGATNHSQGRIRNCGSLPRRKRGHQDRLLPVTPDFAEFLLTTTPGQTGARSSKFTACKRVRRLRPNGSAGSFPQSAKGRGDREQGRQEVRQCSRSSPGVWEPPGSRVKPATLQLLMRDWNIETTLKYYVAQDADEVADELWRQHSPPVAEKPASAPGATPPKVTVLVTVGYFGGPANKKWVPPTIGGTRFFQYLRKRRAWDSNPQPLSGHLISSQAAGQFAYPPI